MKFKENWFISVGVLFVVALIYSFLNSVKSISSPPFLTLLFSNFVWVFGVSVLLYVLLSFAGMKSLVRVLIVGVFTPIILNLLNALFYSVPLKSVYPIALFDSGIVLALLVGGFYFANMIWGKKR